MAATDGSFNVSSFHDQPIHEAVAPVIWLHGTWRSDDTGRGTIVGQAKQFTYSEELRFSSVGQTGLSYSAFSWNSEKNLPMHQESGFLRISPGTNTLALVIGQNTGLAAIEEGEVVEQTISLESKGILRMSFSRGVPVTATKRVFQLKSDSELEQILYMATENHPELTEHLRATYRKID